MSRIIRLLGGIGLFFAFEQSCYAVNWNDLWYNSNQQAAKLLQQHPESAAKLFSDSRWKGVAYFNSHDYQAAAGAFATDKTSDGFYNHGNAQAYQNNYPEAIKAYQEALKLNPHNQDAQYNLDLIKKLQQQQSQQDQKKSQSSGNSKNKNSTENNSDNNSQQSKSTENKSGQSPQNSSNQAAKNNSAGAQKSAGQSGAQSGNNSSANQSNKEPAQPQPASNGAALQNNSSANKAQANPNNSPTAAGSHSGKAQPPNQPNSQQLETAGNKTNNNPANSGAVVATVGNSTQKMTPEDREVAAVLSQIPDDPGGLLRNKFLRDYQNQSAQGSNNGQ